MIVYYFGADAPWEAQLEADINRRNMAMLLAISQHALITKVYNVIRCTRALLFNKNNQKRSQNPKIENLYVAMTFPERGMVNMIPKYLNKSIIKFVNGNRLETKNAISWCYWPKGYVDYQFLGLNNSMIFDTDHNIINDPNLDDNVKAQRAELLLQAGNRAKLILSSARSMLKWYHNNNLKNTKLVMNGAFSSRIDLSSKRQKEDNLVVTYCGTLSKWVKVDWLIRLAKDLPNGTINIIGKNYKTELESELSQLQNIKMHGFLKPYKVDEILRNTDVCIGLYQEDEALDVNSMKIYDYLSKGLPVVVNDYHNHLQGDFENLIQVEKSYSGFLQAVSNANPPSKIALEEFLHKVLWQNRIYEVFNEIED